MLIYFSKDQELTADPLSELHTKLPVFPILSEKYIQGLVVASALGVSVEQLCALAKLSPILHGAYFEATNTLYIHPAGAAIYLKAYYQQTLENIFKDGNTF